MQWFDAAKAGDLATMQRLLAEEPCLLYYRGKGISYGFVGHSALHWVAAKGHVDVVAWLVQEQRANPNVRNNGEGSPLHAAAMGGQHEAARALCAMGIDTTLRNSQGNQARDEALHYKHPDLAQTIDHFTLARKMLRARAEGESWPIKNMKGLLASAGQSTDYSEKAEFIAVSQPSRYCRGLRCPTILARSLRTGVYELSRWRGGRSSARARGSRFLDHGCARERGGCCGRLGLVNG